MKSTLECCVALRVAIGCALAASGCALTGEPAASGETGPIVRGQAPPAFEDGWRPAGGVPLYLAPGELSCETDPALFGPPPGAAPWIAPPTYAPQTSLPAAAPQAGWLDFLPAEGGPIASDFGVPVQPTIGDRIANPIYVRTNGGDAAWEAIADVVTDYFPLRTERRVRQVAGIVEEGQLETQWQSAATILEPWKRDTVGAFNRWQSTLQTLRRRAVVRVIPAASGYEIGVRVDKQLEDLPRPELATAGAASLRNDSSLPTDRLNPVDRVRSSERWIDIGRDEPLEQRMLRDIAQRLGGA
ncbi:hypothetical protein [Botrimarina hoheduenensis]|uniref:hypothetical protein n=1 Tax=Botrimarina hoheduenensis TaxID=2528000 RepID=UPI0011B4A43A|nr:hypothetical protein [Botrimarina hoheduenensis]